MIYRFTFLLLFPLLLSLTGIAQELSHKDSTRFIDAVKKGQLSGNLRYFLMATDNQKGLSDAYANGVSLSLKFETANYHHLQFAVGGATMANLFSADLTKKDPVTGQSNRYEVGLFDLEHPEKKLNLYRLEELYLKYNFKKADLKIGRQFINSSFVNLQDGRLRPTAVEGAFLNLKVAKTTSVQAGWFWKIAPRSTTAFYSIGNILGIYPSGLNTDGTKSGYAGNIKSNGIALLEIKTKPSKTLTLLFSDVFTDNIFNSSLLQADVFIPVGKSQLFFGVQAIQQFAVNHGGNINPVLSYFPENHHAFTFGGKVGVKNKNGSLSFNYNRITAEGRYLFPREWGKDPFFTFLPRERNEGFGDVHAFNFKLDAVLIKEALTANMGTGYYRLPDVNNYTLNKYGMTSYTQLNLGLKYTYKNWGFEFLSASKFDNGKTYHNKKFVINKVDMTNFNFIINYQF